jgi:hypothetical protein
MRYFFFSVFLFAISNNIIAQDTIVFYSNEILFAKISEITNTEISYKRFDFIDGPLYKEKKYAIKFIKFENGVLEHFDIMEEKKIGTYEQTRLLNGSMLLRQESIIPFGVRFKMNEKIYTKNQLLKIMQDKNDTEINEFTINAKRLGNKRYLGFTIIPMAIASIIIGADAASKNASNKKTAYILEGSTSVIFALTGIFAISYDINVSHKRRQYINRAIKRYNENY